jgi:hypothetical protein
VQNVDPFEMPSAFQKKPGKHIRGLQINNIPLKWDGW